LSIVILHKFEKIFLYDLFIDKIRRATTVRAPSKNRFITIEIATAVNNILEIPYWICVPDVCGWDNRLVWRADNRLGEYSRGGGGISGKKFFSIVKLFRSEHYNLEKCFQFRITVLS
jgi:hypothetical protein